MTAGTAAPPARQGFGGAEVVCFESRMADAMAARITAFGGTPLPAPALREAPLTAQEPVRLFGERLLAGAIDVAIFLTGSGTRLLLERLATWHPADAVAHALSRCTLVTRGPKPAQALREWRVRGAIGVPEPETWQAIVQALETSERGIDLAGKRVAVQEYGVPNPQLIDALRARGAEVLQVPVYRWVLPDDTAPLSRAIARMIDGRATVALFTNATQVLHLLQFAETQGQGQVLREAMRRMRLASIGPTTSEALQAHGLPVSLEASQPKLEVLVEEASRAETAPPSVRVSARPSGAQGASPASGRSQSLFLKACRREPTPVTPVWLMRQAGRYMKEYRDLRSRVSFLELCKRPDLCAEVAVTAAERLGVDAAILFSDILLIVEPLGLGLEYSEGEGPVISGRVAAREDVDRLREPDPRESLAFVFDAVRATRAALPDALPLIGFSGAPFTLAAYILEGGSSTTFLQTKRFMYADPGAWHALLAKISRALVSYLNGQIAAGADCVQLFDSWVGCLGPEAYREFVLPHTQAVIRSLTPGVPVIHFGTGTGPFLADVRAAGGDVIGADFRVSLDAAWQAIGHDAGIQGNLDPALLFAEPGVIRAQVQRILDQAGGRPGHIFNLGHGVLPKTPVEHVIGLVRDVHELSARR